MALKTRMLGENFAVEIQDVDLAEAISDMSAAEIALQAVIESSKRLMGATALRWLS